MPAQRSTRARRSRGSWLPRMAGMGAVGLLAAGGLTAYLMTMRPDLDRPGVSLPTRVLTVQTVGLVAVGPAASGGRAVPQMLVVARSGLAYAPVPRSRLVTGNPEWTADQMAGSTYVFIYSPSGRCLAAAALPAPRLALQHCDLGASQRWRPVHPAVVLAGRSYQQFSNLASGSCLAVGGTSPSAAPGEAPAELARCGQSPSWRQLISFWW